MLKTLLEKFDIHPILDSSLQFGPALVLDMTSDEWLGAHQLTTEQLIQKTKSLMQAAKAKIAVGGYAEDRGLLYSRSSLFEENNTYRSVHLGVDLTVPAKTPVYTPLPAKLHSFSNNQEKGDYGPVVILEHDLEGLRFYTLYGHLTQDSLADLFPGKTYSAGECFAEIGDETENGDWPPHLHFQIIKDLQGAVGSYPGVAASCHAALYLENCPDPNLILKIPALTTTPHTF